MEQGSAGVRR